MFLLICASLCLAEIDSLNERVSSALLVAVQDHFPNEDISTQISYLGVRAKSPCRESIDVQITFSRKEDFQGPLDATATLFDEDGQCARWRFRPRVAIWRDVPVAADAAFAGERVNVSMEKKRYDLVQGTLIADAEGPWIARRSIQKGDFLTQDVLRKMPTNENGDRVQLNVNVGNLTIKAEGKLMTNAHVGDKVKVLSFATNVVVEGVLVEKGMVKVGGLQ